MGAGTVGGPLAAAGTVCLTEVALGVDRTEQCMDNFVHTYIYRLSSLLSKLRIHENQVCNTLSTTAVVGPLCQLIWHCFLPALPVVLQCSVSGEQ